MSKASVVLLSLALIMILVFLGCTKPYIITDTLTGPLTEESSCSIGAIVDDLPADFDEDKKPNAESIENLKTYLYEQLDDKNIFVVIREELVDAEYEVTGSILDYKKGSGFLRFLFGAWAGEAKVVVALRLVNVNTNEIIFGGNFTGRVTSWAEGGDAMFKRVAKDFAKQLQEGIEDLEKKSG